MDLGLRIARNTPVAAEIARELTKEEVVGLEGLGAPSLKSLRDSHHQIARLVAAGMDNVEISQVTGKSPGTVSFLKRDPAFIELLNFYRGRQEVAYADLHERLRNLGGTAMALMQERLEEEPEKISNSLLLEVVKTTADRVGHGPRQTQVNINFDLEARLDAARRRAGLEEERGEAAATPLLVGPGAK